MTQNSYYNFLKSIHRFDIFEQMHDTLRIWHCH